MELKNEANSLHGGATAALVDLVGGSVVPTINNVTNTGVSMEINVSYFDAACVGDEMQIEAKALHVGKAVAVATVEFRNKETGKNIAQGRHTKYLAVSSKLSKDALNHICLHIYNQMFRSMIPYHREMKS